MNGKRKFLMARNVKYISMMLAFLCLMEAMLSSTRCTLYDASLYWHWLFIFLFIISYFAGNYYYLQSNSVNTVKQLCAVNVAGTILLSILIMTKQQELREYGRNGYFVSCLAVWLVCAVSAILEIRFVFRSASCCRQQRMPCKKEILILLIMVGTVAVVCSGSEPRWDSAYLFNYILATKVSDLFNLQALQFCGHLSMGYVGINMILAYLFDDLSMGMTAGNIFLYLLSVWCMYGIIKMILCKKSEICYALLTSIYAFSPFVLGLVNYNYWDYWTTVLFPIIVYTAMRNKWIYHFIVAFFFIFTKETAFLSYAFWCVGMVVFDSRLRDKGTSVRNRIKELATDRRYISMLVLGISWLVMWRFLPHWNGEGSFSFDIAYMIQKLKVFYVFNFNWILSILSLMFCVRTAGYARGGVREVFRADRCK